MPGPRADGCIACREGDTVLIGFRADADSSDEAPDQTESVNDSSGQDEPGESERDLADDDPQSPVEHEPDAVEPRQRNRSRTPPLSAAVDQELPGLPDRVLRSDAAHEAVAPLAATTGPCAVYAKVCRLDDEPPPGRPDPAGRTGPDRIVARAFGFWAGQQGQQPPLFQVPRPEVAPALGLQAGFMRIRFLLFSPEYTPEVVEVDVPIGCSAASALQEVQARRSDWSREVFPAVFPAHPQPVAGYAAGLALPPDRSFGCKFTLSDNLHAKWGINCLYSKIGV